MLSASLPLVACGAPATPPDDAGGGTDAGLVIAPPIAPALAPCPAGWRAVVDDSGVTICDPWPATGNASATCAPDEAHFPGTPGCARIGTACAADGWASDLPAGRTIVYVDDGAAAGGDGSTRARAFTTLAAGVAAAPADAVIALATGRYDEQSVELGSGQTIWGACVEGTALASTVAGGAPLVILGADGAGLRNLAVDRPDRIAIGVTAARTTVEDVVVRGARFALFVMSGGVNVHHVAIREGRTETDGTEGRAVDVGGGAHVVLDVVVIERNPQFGIWVGGAGSSVTASDVAITDITPLALDPSTGRGLYADDGATFQLARVAIERSAETALYVYGVGTSAMATDLVIRDVQPNSAGALGRGIVLQAGATAMLDRCLVAGARDVAVVVAGTGSDLTLRDGAVVRTLSDQASMRYGRGVVVSGGAHVAATRLVVDQARESAMLVGDVGTRVELADVALRRTQTAELDGDWGSGLWVQDGALLTLTRGTIEASHLTGVLSITEATVELSDVTVRDVVPTDCAMTTCAERSAAFGLVAHFGGALRATRFAVDHVTVCGVVVGPSNVTGTLTAMDLAMGEVSSVAVGACVQADGFDTARLRSAVAYRDVGVPLQATTYALPSPVTLGP